MNRLEFFLSVKLYSAFGGNRLYNCDLLKLIELVFCEDRHPDPTAVVFGSGYETTARMVRAGA